MAKGKWAIKNLSWILLSISIIVITILILHGLRPKTDPAINRLEKLNAKIEQKILKDSLYVISQQDKIVKLQDTVIYINKYQTKIIEKHNENITRINFLTGNSLLQEVRRSIRYLDSLDKSGGFYLPSNPSN